MELKTLKDFKKYAEEEMDCEIERGYILALKDLNQEAIKYINLGGSFNELIKKYMKDKNNYDLIDSDLEDFACDVLMHFFNITEEDLK